MSADYHIEVVATEQLTAEQRSAVIEVCVAAHESEEFRRIFSHYIPSGGRHFLGYADEALVSHAVVTTRGLQPAGEPILRTAFVDAVSTLPAQQEQGHASKVMRRLAADVDDYDVGCLQTDIPGFYARLGWEEWRGPLAGRGDDGLIPTPDQRGVMILRLPQTPPLDLDARLTIEVQPTRIWE